MSASYTEPASLSTKIGKDPELSQLQSETVAGSNSALDRCLLSSGDIFNIFLTDHGNHPGVMLREHMFHVADLADRTLLTQLAVHYCLTQLVAFHRPMQLAILYYRSVRSLVVDNTTTRVHFTITSTIMGSYCMISPLAKHAECKFIVNLSLSRTNDVQYP